MKSCLKLLFFILCCGLVLGGAAPAGAAKVLKISHLNPADPFRSHSGALTVVFKSLVESGTNGSIQVELYPDGQLGKDDEVIQQVRDGIVQSCISSAGGLAEHYPLIGIFDLPFAFPNIAIAHEVIDLNSDFGRKLAADIESKIGLKVVGLMDSGGFFAITNSRRPIRSLDDVQDLRIRTMTLPTHEAIIAALGARPTALPWPEVYTALQTNVVDGQMNPIPIISFAKFDEVQKHLALTNHLITPYVWLMNAAFYEKLTAAERYVVHYAARAAVDAGRGLSRIVEASAERGLPFLQSRMQVTAVSRAERERFAKAAQPAVKKLIEEKYGAEGMTMLRALLASIEAAHRDSD